MTAGSHFVTNFSCIQICAGGVLQKPPVLVLSMSEAFVVVPLSSEQLLVVKYAVQFSVQRRVAVHATNEHSITITFHPVLPALKCVTLGMIGRRKKV